MAHSHCLSSQQPDVVQMPVPAAHAHASTIPACNSLKPFVTCRRLIPVSDTYKGDSFFTIENGKKIATPLLLVLAVVELSDVVFAVDSIPAVSAISALLLYSCAICLDGIALHPTVRHTVQFRQADVRLQPHIPHIVASTSLRSVACGMCVQMCLAEQQFVLHNETGMVFNGQLTLGLLDSGVWYYSRPIHCVLFQHVCHSQLEGPVWLCEHHHE